MPPVGGKVHVQGTSSMDSTTWFDVKTGQVEKMAMVDSTDQTTTFAGITGLPSPIVGLPSPPVIPGLLLPDLLGPQHFAARQTLQFDLVS